MKIRKIRTKKAMTIKHILELVLGVAVATLLGFLFFYLLAPGPNEHKEAAESFSKVFKDVLEEVDETHSGQFNMWDVSKRIIMVVFNDKRLVEIQGFEITNPNMRGQYDTIVKRTLFAGKAGENIICFCYDIGGSWNCKCCQDLEYPVESYSNLFMPGVQIEVSLDAVNEKYVLNGAVKSFSLDFLKTSAFSKWEARDTMQKGNQIVIIDVDASTQRQSGKMEFKIRDDWKKEMRVCVYTDNDDYFDKDKLSGATGTITVTGDEQCFTSVMSGGGEMTIWNDQDHGENSFRFRKDKNSGLVYQYADIDDDTKVCFNCNGCGECTIPTIGYF